MDGFMIRCLFVAFIVEEVAGVEKREPFKERFKGLRLFIRPETEPGRCQPYRGGICGDFLFNGSSKADHPPIVYTTDLLPSPFLLNQAAAKIYQQFREHVPKPCLDLAMKMICKYMYPDCVDVVTETTKGKHLDLCYEDCNFFRNGACYYYWTHLENVLSSTSKQISTNEREIILSLPECGNLPMWTTAHHCSHVHMEDALDERNFTADCYYPADRHYHGTANKTVKGFPCLRWDSQCPYERHQKRPLHAELSDASNFCRNPLGGREQPWCFYMSDQGVHWDFCGVPPCIRKAESTAPPGIDNSPFVISLFALFALLVLVIAAFLAYRQCFAGGRKKHLSGTSFHRPDLISVVETGTLERSVSSPGRLDLTMVTKSYLWTNSVYYETQSAYAALADWEYSRNELVYIEDVGKGAFATVFHGYANKLSDGANGTGRDVAVKVLKENANERVKRNFEREALVAAELSHDNVVKLLGVCFRGIGQHCLIFEFMPNKDLNTFIRACSPNASAFLGLTNGSVCDRTSLDNDDLLCIVEQIALGMEYFASKGWVHRDLATRNCLVGRNLCVKISDFGLSERVMDKDYIIMDPDSDLYVPIRWMPPEAIRDHIFSVKSDVWAFGVVVWEVFEFGLWPYFGKNHQEVIRFVTNGEVLSRPKKASEEVYQLMLKCWRAAPKDRISFADAHSIISRIRRGAS